MKIQACHLNVSCPFQPKINNYTKGQIYEKRLYTLYAMWDLCEKACQGRGWIVTEILIAEKMNYLLKFHGRCCLCGAWTHHLRSGNRPCSKTWGCDQYCCQVGMNRTDEQLPGKSRLCNISVAISCGGLRWRNLVYNDVEFKILAYSHLRWNVNKRKHILSTKAFPFVIWVGFTALIIHLQHKITCITSIEHWHLSALSLTNKSLKGFFLQSFMVLL